jgi:hypothetical protein
MVVVGASSREEMEESSSVPVITLGESLLRAIVQEKSAFGGYREQVVSLGSQWYNGGGKAHRYESCRQEEGWH